MKRRINSFFIEIIIVVLFFALSASIVIQFIVAANQKSSLSRDISISMVKSQDIIENFKAYSEPDKLLDFISNVQIEDNNSDSAMAYLYYDKSWNTSESPDRYRMSISVNSSDTAQSGFMLHAKVTVEKENSNGDYSQIICSLEADKYLPKLISE